MKKQILFLLIAVLPFSIMAQKNYVALLEQYVKGFHKAHDFSGVVLVTKKGNHLKK